MLRYAHDLCFTYKDLNSFSIKNLNLLNDIKILELMNLLHENNYKNDKLQKIIGNNEKKKKLKILIVENYLDLIFFK